MQKHQKEVLQGLVISSLLWLLVFVLFLLFLTPFPFNKAINGLSTQKILGKVMALCAIPNVLLFFYFIKKQKDMMAKGVILFALLLAITTIFI